MALPMAVRAKPAMVVVRLRRIVMRTAALWFAVMVRRMRLLASCVITVNLIQTRMPMLAVRIARLRLAVTVRRIRVKPVMVEENPRPVTMTAL
jgi:hypothetical protein